MSSDSTIKRLPLEHRIALHRELIETGVLPSCANCVNMADGQLVCLKYNATPPLEVLSVGCIAWEQTIPF